MIPKTAILSWRKQAPWGTDAQVEHDLLLSRILIELFNDKFLSTKLAFRGGTAIHKLFIKKMVRFSEDIDLVQLNAEPIGETLGRLHDLLNPWLGQPKVMRGEGRATMIYRTLSEDAGTPIRIKLEINTREHQNVLGLKHIPLEVKNAWFSGAALINTYTIEELMATKLRALYQRKKGRDLFDFYAVIKEIGLDPKKMLGCFKSYMQQQDARVTKAQFQENLEKKRLSRIFNEDMRALLPIDIDHEYEPEWIYKYIFREVIACLPGEDWKGLKITSD